MRYWADNPICRWCHCIPCSSGCERLRRRIQNPEEAVAEWRAARPGGTREPLPDSLAARWARIQREGE